MSNIKVGDIVKDISDDIIYRIIKINVNNYAKYYGILIKLPKGYIGDWQIGMGHSLAEVIKLSANVDKDKLGKPNKGLVNV